MELGGGDVGWLGSGVDVEGVEDGDLGPEGVGGGDQVVFGEDESAVGVEHCGGSECDDVVEADVSTVGGCLQEGSWTVSSNLWNVSQLLTRR